MRYIISVSAHQNIEQGTKKFTDPMNERDFYELAATLFGAALPDREQIRAFDTVRGPVTITRTGSNSAVWMYGDKKLTGIEDLIKMFRPLPTRTPVRCGDTFMSIRGRGHFQYLIAPFKSKELMWFDKPEQVEAYYAERKIKPAFRMMDERKAGVGIVKSWSSNQEDGVYYADMEALEAEHAAQQA